MFTPAVSTPAILPKIVFPIFNWSLPVTTGATVLAPIIILLEPVVKAVPASKPMAVLLEPVLELNVLYPRALLPVPATLFLKDEKPTAVLLLLLEDVNACLPIATLLKPIEFEYRLPEPNAVLALPVVFENKANSPIPVFSLPEVNPGITFTPIAVFLTPDCVAKFKVGFNNELAPNEVFPLMKSKDPSYVGLPINPPLIAFLLKTKSTSSVVPRKFVAGAVPALPIKLQSVDVPEANFCQTVPS